MEQLGNLAYTTLSASYTSGSGSLQVASSSTGSGALPFPSSTPFSVNIVDQVTGVVTALLKVTAIPDGTHFTVTTDGLDANANSGDFVYIVQTADSMPRFVGEYNTVGVYASLPGTARSGWTYKATDTPHNFIYDGSNWNTFIAGYKVTDPTTLSPSWSPSQGGATETVASGMRYLVGEASGSCDIRARVIAVPSAPYTRTALCFFANPTTHAAMSGICVSDGTKFEVLSMTYSSGILLALVQQFTNATTFASQPSQTTISLNGNGPVLFRINDNNTNRLYQVSPDLGVNWFTVATIGRTAFLTPTQIGWFANSYTSNTTPAITIASWS